MKPVAADYELDRDHTFGACALISSSLAFCITVDILQYSMPLAFLPSVLEDRGHSSMEIATAIGVYYWTGFLGQVVITSAYLYQLLAPCSRKALTVGGPLYVSDVTRKIWYLVYGLAVGTASLLCQAAYPGYHMHAACRLVQGFAGAFIFFYAFLLSAEVFEKKQQVFAMTLASSSLNVAEVLGSSLGAQLYDAWGQRAVFACLGIVSLANQCMLVGVLRFLKPIPIESNEQSGSNFGGDSPPESPAKEPSESRPVSFSSEPPNTARSGFSDESGRAQAHAGRSPSKASYASGRRNTSGSNMGRRSHELTRLLSAQSTADGRPLLIAGWTRLKYVLRNRQMQISVTLIVMSSATKGAVEEMLPFHADHRWGLSPVLIGELFSLIAVAYISAAALAGKLWECVFEYRVFISAFCLAMLGLAAWSTFLTISYSTNEILLKLQLLVYGIFLGLTHTPAAFLLAEAIEMEEGIAKDAVNGIWNTMWEAGGSIGFLLGGLLGDNYSGQVNLLGAGVVSCACGAAVMVALERLPPVDSDDEAVPTSPKLRLPGQGDYGSTAWNEHEK
jgi:MFS family permease